MTVNNPSGSAVGATPTDRATLQDALTEANIPTLLMVLVHLTGDRRWLEAPFTPARAVGLGDNDTGGLEAELQEQIRAAALDAVLRYYSGELEPQHPAPDEISRMLGVALAEDIPENYGELLSEELGLSSRDVDFADVEHPERMSALIIGSGLSGLCAAIKLKASGVDFIVLEKNSELGGTWFENTYPGVGVDTPSHLYSFTFAMSSLWSRYFAKGGEVNAYLNRLADQYDVRRHIRFGIEVDRAEWDESTGQWQVHAVTSDGSTELLSARALISAVGMVNRPSTPDIPGIDDFEGPILHTAKWDSDVSLDGLSVGVVGTGASAMQLVPSIVDDTGRVTIFQRSKQWALPHPNYHRAVSDRVHALFDHVPFYLAWYRLRSFWNFSDRLHAGLQIDPDWPHQDRSINATNERHRLFLTKYITQQLGDRTDLIDACVPDYPPYGKRPLVDNGWYAMLRRDDVELVTEGVAAVTRSSIISTGGAEYPVDAIVMATGFKVLQMLYPLDIRGRSGKTLRGQTWEADDARAYLGITVPDYPNFFIINGPNTNAGHGGSAIHGTEFQVRYILQALKHLLQHDGADLEPQASLYEQYNTALDDALARTVWAHPGMTTYYRNDAGRIVITNPWPYIEYWGRTKEFVPDDFVVRAGALASAGEIVGASESAG